MAALFEQLLGNLLAGVDPAANLFAAGGPAGNPLAAIGPAGSLLAAAGPARPLARLPAMDFQPAPRARSRSRSRGSEREDLHRSRSRSRRRRRRRRRRRGGILTFGMHAGQSYEETWRNQRGYCRWAMNVPHPSGPLRDFQRWLARRQRRDETGSASEESLSLGLSDSSDSSDSDGNGHVGPAADLLGLRIADLFDEEENGGLSAGGGGHRRDAAAAQRISDAIGRLPRVAYNERFFSGEPYPESCPICMESFKEDTDAPAASSQAPQAHEREIALTPCLHVFHTGCLKGWLARSHECPSCRWNVLDTGAGKVLQSSAQSASQASSSVVLPAELVGSTFVVSDSDGDEG
eukprot:TRINITY_DN32582_c0_g1_i1.p1 TRINITY_DN32582_c0_g1~~TRINITY_DN32582_c0_g1_i1.p1  ORF type:complete len:349 (+),score=53.21 TRINITY_DN32582_c0_g1_i1:177-1223(+)